MTEINARLAMIGLYIPAGIATYFAVNDNLLAWFPWVILSTIAALDCFDCLFRLKRDDNNRGKQQ